LEDEVLLQDTTNVGPQDMNMAKPAEETVIDLECYTWSYAVCNADSDPVLKSTEGNSTEDVPIIYEPFLSKVTLDILRVTILSTIDVVELLFQDNYKYVPTGKFNQDCIEVRNMDNIFLFLTVYYQLLRHLNFTSSYVLNFLLF
jgi:hypothetical protein